MNDQDETDTANTEARAEAAFLNALETGQVVVLVTGKDDRDGDFWAYLRMMVADLPHFRMAETQGDYDLGDFGEIIAHGPGPHPPADIRAKMAQDYGAMEDWEQKLAEIYTAVLRARSP